MKAANVRSITDLKNRAKELIRDVSESGQSVVITQTGQAKVVVMDVEQHDRLQDMPALLKILAQSHESLTKTGRTYSSAEVRRRTRSVLDKATHR